MRTTAVLAAMTMGLGASGTVASAHSERTNAVTIGCNQSANPMNPGAGSNTAGEHLVLARVWLPKSTIIIGRTAWRDVPTGQRAFVKFGITVTAGTPVRLSVPVGSERAYVLDFHGVGRSGVLTLNLDPCPLRDGPTTTWAGGYLVLHPACVPLRVTVGHHSLSARLPLGRSC